MKTEANRMLLSTDEVAEALGCSRRKIYRMRDREELPKFLKFGKSLKMRKAELEDWVNAGMPPRSRWEWEGGR